VRVAIALLLVSCAPLSASTMSERCRDIYDSCLDGCRPLPRPSTGRPPEPGQLPPPSSNDWQIDVASCTNDCNKASESCR
jgi:hypothetical protein